MIGNITVGPIISSLIAIGNRKGNPIDYYFFLQVRSHVYLASVLIVADVFCDNRNRE